MKVEIARRWAKALRSGEYVQGNGFLKTSNVDGGNVRHCCLGVLCEIAIKDGVQCPVVDGIHSLTNLRTHHYGVERNHTAVPHEVLAWSGLKHPLGFLPKDDAFLCRLNDGGMGFNEIASVIEDHFIPDPYGIQRMLSRTDLIEDEKETEPA